MLNEQDLIRLVIQQPKYLQKLLKQDALLPQTSSAQKNQTKVEIDKKSKMVTLNKAPQQQDNQEASKMSLTKEQQKELIGIIYSVYSGMAKYIQSQADKGRVVDFPLLGKFAAKSSSESTSRDKEYIFLPNLDFLSSGKFSFPENDQNIPPFSKRAPTFQATSVVSLSAISSVSSLDRELVANILKDIFVKFIECNRQGHEIRIDLKCGQLHALPNGELQFENKSSEDAAGIQVHDQSKYVKRQLKDNADIDIQLRQFQTGGNVGGRSMKSAFMSVKTPYTHGTRTQVSKKSQSIASHNKFNHSSYNWRQVFQNGSQQKQSQQDIYSQFSKGSRLGNPNSQANFRSSSMGGNQNASPFENATQLPQLGSKGGALSQAKMSEYSDTRSQVLEKMAQNEYIPIETFDQFVMKKMGTRPGKRIFFQNNDGTEEKQKILQSYLQDMKVKQMDKLEQKKAKLADEIKDIEENNKKLHEMKIKEKNKKFQKEAQFRQQVEEVKKERQLNNQMDEDYRRAGLGENYFPFTHGDQVEIHRQQMREEMSNQLKEFQEKDKQTFIQNQSQGGTRNEKLGDNSGNTDIANTSQAESTSAILHQGKEKSENLRLKFLDQNPFFLKRHENVRVKQTNQQLYDDAMEKARIRFEAQLQKEKSDQESFQQQHKSQYEDNIKYSEALKLQKLKKVKENQLLIQQQIDEKKMMKDYEQNARREKYQTNWGPEENEKTVQMEILKKEFYKESLSKDLQGQINLQKMATNEQKYVDGILDKQSIEQALHFEKEELNQSQKIKDQHRQLLKNAWEDQIKMKEDVAQDKFSKQNQIIMTK